MKEQIDYRLKDRGPKIEFNIDYIMYGKDPKTGKSIKPFTRELESSDKELFKPKKSQGKEGINTDMCYSCLLYTSPSPRDRQKSRMPSSA